MAYKQISPQSVAEGGTGAQTLTGVLTGNGTSAITANAITQYKVLIGGTSNAVSEVASVGTATQVLTSNGAGANPTFQDPSSGPGSLILLSTQNASSSSLIEFKSLISATYVTYFFTFSNVVPSVAGSLKLEVSSDNGSSYITTNYLSATVWASYSVSTESVATATTFTYLTNDIKASGIGACGFGYFYNVGNGQQFMTEGQVIFDVNGSTFGKSTWSSVNTSTAVNAFKVYPASGNMTTGKFSLYGVVQ